MKISEGSTEEVAREGGVEQGDESKGETLDYLTFFAQDRRVNIMFLLNHDILIYRFIFVYRYSTLSVQRTRKKRVMSFSHFFFYNFSRLYVNAHYLLETQVPRDTSLFSSLLFYGTFCFVFPSQLNKM